MFAYIHLFLILVVLLALNEVFRWSKWLTLAFFLGVPIILTPTIWYQNGTTPGSSINTWFHWAKLYSVIAAVLGFTLMRYTKWGENRYMKAFPALILAVNIAEAVARDFELGITQGGMWHYFNAIAGILSIVTISGWSGIFAEKGDKQDLIWLDMMPFWIIAYDIWNLIYIWFCVPNHAGYGISVLLACTIPSLFVKKGTWVQARAFTLAVWMMYVFTFPNWIDIPTNQVLLPQQPAVLMTVGLISLAANGAFAFIHFSKMFNKKVFVLGQEVHA